MTHRLDVEKAIQAAGVLLRLLRSGTVETFMRADPPVTNGRIERDLFEGIPLQA